MVGITLVVVVALESACLERRDALVAVVAVGVRWTLALSVDESEAVLAVGVDGSVGRSASRRRCAGGSRGSAAATIRGMSPFEFIGAELEASSIVACCSSVSSSLGIFFAASCWRASDVSMRCHRQNTSPTMMRKAMKPMVRAVSMLALLSGGASSCVGPLDPGSTTISFSAGWPGSVRLPITTTFCNVAGGG